MSCNCVSQEQIKKLHELYGDKVKANTPTTLKFKIKNFLSKLMVAIILLIISPMLIFYILYNVWFTKEHRVSIRKFLGIRKSKTLDDAMAKSILENVEK